MGEYYIGPYRDHYAIFDSMDRVQTQYDTHAEAKADLDSYNKTGKPLPEATSKDSIIDKAFKGVVNATFDTSSKEFKKVGNDVGNDKKAKQTWWSEMKLTARMHKKPYPKVNGYTNGDFTPNHEWLMTAIEQCKSVADCECLIKDAYLGISQDKQLVKNLRAVKEGNPSRYVNVKLVQKWLDSGVTPEKVEKHIEWMKENYIKGLQAKKKEFKKLNEDYSEVKIDPEMEQLMKLAEVTTEDLDDLEDDNVMDESATEYLLEGFFNFKKKKEKDIQVENVSPDEIKKLPVNFKKAYDGWYYYLTFTDNNIGIDDLAKISTKIRRVCNVNFGIDVYPTKFMVCNAKDMIKEFKTKDFFSEQFVKANGSILLFDYDWLSGGNSKYISTLKTNLGMRYFYDVINNSMYRYVEAMHYLDDISMEDAINTNKYYPVSYIDKKGIMAIYNYHNVNTQKYMKKQNESVTGAAIIAGLITTGIVAGAIADAKNTRDNTIEITDKEFDEKMNSISKISDEIIRSFKSSKYWNLVYEPCMTYKSKDIKSQISKMKDAFNKGKAVRPMIYINLVDLDNFDPKIYTKLDKESEKPYSNPDYEDLWDEVSSKSYYEGIDTLKHTLEKLGFYKNGVSPKYPGLIVTDNGGAEYVSFTVKLSDNKYYKKISNKSLKESVVEDYMYDLDFMMESFLSDF